MGSVAPMLLANRLLLTVTAAGLTLAGHFCLSARLALLARPATTPIVTGRAGLMAHRLECRGAQWKGSRHLRVGSRIRPHMPG
jgi:hypothetical protein